MSKVVILILSLFIVECKAMMGVLYRIITTNEIQRVTEELRIANAECLVILDCDDVLIEPCDPILQDKNQDAIKESMEVITDRFNIKKTDLAKYKSIIMRDMRQQLLNPEWPLLISELQQQNIKVLLLTQCMSGEYGVIASMEEWRRSWLLSFGIDFAQSWPNSTQVIPLDDRYTVNPVFANGMLLTGNANKCDTLRCFLSRFPQYTPIRIIFVDDRAKNLASVGKTVNELGIEFIGIEYTYAKTKEGLPLDPAKVGQKFDILIQQERWESFDGAQVPISDQEESEVHFFPDDSETADY